VPYLRRAYEFLRSPRIVKGIASTPRINILSLKSKLSRNLVKFSEAVTPSEQLFSKADTTTRHVFLGNRERRLTQGEVSEMFNTLILRPLVKPFIVWRNPQMTDIVEKHSDWTLRQLYLDAKGERAQHKVLQMAVRQSPKG
jgi:hypothetical protein